MNLISTFKKQGGTKLIRQYIKGRVLKTAIGQFILLGGSKTSLEILRNSVSLKIIKKLDKKYSEKIRDIELKYIPSENNNERKVWLCWFQGLESSPEIVQKCISSIKKNIKDREVIFLDIESYKNYIKFPSYIEKKINKGIISGAHLSDLIRLELLDKYGGTWIDATVFCSSSKIPKYMLDSELFMFQCLKPGSDGQATIISNWFITAKANHKLIFMIKELLYEYWKNNDELVDYFIFHDFFQILIDRYPEEWESVIPFSNSLPHILLLRLFEEYNEETWKAVLDMTPFHKLTYKFDEDVTKLDGTYYKKILES